MKIPALFVLTAALSAQDPALKPQPVQPMLLPQAFVLPRGDVQLTIDGSLVEWPELPAVRLDDTRQLSGTAMGAWRGPDDASAAVFFLWDADSLYVACSYRDDWHRALSPETLQLTEIPAADSILLIFDPDRNTRSNGPDPGRSEDRSFWLADEDAREVVAWDRLRGSARVLAGDEARCVALHDKEQGITTFEARLPWSEILPPGRVPAVGDCIDLQIVVSDFDESTDSMPQTRLGWTFGLGPLVDPGLFGTMMLTGDRAVMQGKVPEIPPKPGAQLPEDFGAMWWREFAGRLDAHPPGLYDGKVTPAEVGGVERFEVLDQLDRSCERYPRVDVLELLQRVDRRMQREAAGMSARGLPRFWADRLVETSRRGAEAVPAHTARLFRLPMGGWMCRSERKNFLVDAIGADLEQFLWGAAEFCLVTRPLDIECRNDQLLVRLLTAEPARPLFAHITFHLPFVEMEKSPLVVPGRTYGEAPGTRVFALGTPRADGAVTADCSYRVVLADGPVLVFCGPTLRVDEVDPEWRCEALVVSPRNPQAIEIVQRLRPGVVFVDEALMPATHADRVRVTLEDVLELQRAFLPVPSVLLAPGESWDIARRM